MNVSPEAPPDLAELAELAAVTRVPSFCFSTGKKRINLRRPPQ
jgi:hypothetical protein